MKPDDVKWVVNDMAELGVEINGRYFFLYKGRSLEYDGVHEDGTPMLVRGVGKREFGFETGRYTKTYQKEPHVQVDPSSFWVPLPRR